MVKLILNKKQEVIKLWVLEHSLFNVQLQSAHIMQATDANFHKSRLATAKRMLKSTEQDALALKKIQTFSKKYASTGMFSAGLRA